MKNIATFLLTLSLAAPVMAETIPGTNLEVFVEAASVGGSGRTVSIKRLPVRNSVTGETNYYDVAFELTANGAGEVAFDRISLLDLSAMLPSSNAFRAGIYLDNKGNYYELSGPSISAKGYEMYSLTLRQGTSLTSFSGSLSTMPVREQFPSLASVATLENYEDSHAFGSLALSGTFGNGSWASGNILSGYMSGDTATFYQWHTGSISVTVTMSHVASRWEDVTVD